MAHSCKKAIAVLVFSAFLVACAGRSAAPVIPTQYHDKNMNCEQVSDEMRRIEGEIRALYPQSDKTAKNVGLGIAGWFFIIPWFFMDLGDAEKIEIEAYKSRYENLRYLAHEKCG